MVIPSFLFRARTRSAGWSTWSSTTTTRPWISPTRSSSKGSRIVFKIANWFASSNICDRVLFLRRFVEKCITNVNIFVRDFAGLASRINSP